MRRVIPTTILSALVISLSAQIQYSTLSFQPAKGIVEKLPSKKIVHTSNEGDCFVFSNELGALKKGTCIDLWVAFTASPVEKEHHFMLEYLDGKKWVPVIPVKKGEKWNCTSTLSTKHPRRIWQTIELKRDLKGAFSFRLRQIDKEELSVALFTRNRGQLPSVVVLGKNETVDRKKILFLGNSYTHYNMYPLQLKQIAWSEGHFIEGHAFLSGGYTFKNHMSTKECMETISIGDYNIACIQDQSLSGAIVGTEDEGTIVKDTKKISNIIRTSSPDARIILENTWGRKFGNNKLGKKYEFLNEKYPERFASYEAMQNALNEGFKKSAEVAFLELALVGQAWSIVRQEHPELELYYKDGHHPSMLGSYLIATIEYLTIYKTPFTEKVSNCAIEPETAKYIRSVAQRVVFGK